MKIFRAMGLVLAIIALKFLMPAVFDGLESTLVAFFDTVKSVLDVEISSLPASVSLPGIPR